MKPITPKVARALSDTLGNLAIDECGLDGDAAVRIFLKMAEHGELPVSRADMEAAGIVVGETVDTDKLKEITEGRAIGA